MSKPKQKQYTTEEIAKFNIEHGVHFWKSEQINDYLAQQESLTGSISEGKNRGNGQQSRVGQTSLFGERKNVDPWNQSLAQRAWNWFTDTTHLTSPPTYTDGYGVKRNAETSFRDSAQGQELDRMGRTALKAGEIGLAAYTLPALASGMVAAPLLTTAQIAGAGALGYAGSKAGEYVDKNVFGGDGWWGSNLGGLSSAIVGGKGATTLFKNFAPVRYTGEMTNLLGLNYMQATGKPILGKNWWGNANTLTEGMRPVFKANPNLTPDMMLGGARNWFAAQNAAENAAYAAGSKQPQSTNIQLLPGTSQQQMLPVGPQQPLALPGVQQPLALPGQARVEFPFDPIRQGKWDAVHRRDLGNQDIERIEYDNMVRYPDYQVRVVDKSYVDGDFGPQSVKKYGVVDGNGELVKGDFIDRSKANFWLWQQDRNPAFWNANRQVKYGTEGNAREQAIYKALLQKEFDLANQYYIESDPTKQNEILQAYNDARIARERYRKNIDGFQNKRIRNGLIEDYRNEDAQMFGQIRKQQYDAGHYTSEGLPFRRFWIGDQVNDREFLMKHLYDKGLDNKKLQQVVKK